MDKALSAIHGDLENLDRIHLRALEKTLGYRFYNLTSEEIKNKVSKLGECCQRDTITILSDTSTPMQREQAAKRLLRLSSDGQKLCKLNIDGQVFKLHIQSSTSGEEITLIGPDKDRMILRPV